MNNLCIWDVGRGTTGVIYTSLQQHPPKIWPSRLLPGKYVKGWRKWSERRQTWVAIFEFQARNLCVRVENHAMWGKE